MIEERSTEIRERTYVFTPLSAKPARDCLAELVKIFGPGASKALDGVKGATLDSSILDESIDEVETVMKVLGPLAGSLSGLIDGVVTNLTGPRYEKILNTFLNQVYWDDVENNQKHFLTSKYREFEYATSLRTEAEILLWCLKEQYGDFFDFSGKVSEYAKAMAVKMANRFTSPKQSTGGSNGLPRPTNIQVD